MREAAAAGIAAFALGLVFTRALMAALERLSARQVVREDGPSSHLVKSKTLTMGGLGFAAAGAIGAGLFGGWSHPWARAAFVAAASCGLLGALDDYKKIKGGKSEGLKARYKLAAQIAIAAGLAWRLQASSPAEGAGIFAPGRLTLPLGWGGLELGALYWPLAVVVFIGTVNAVNFTDGLDGLLGGSVIGTLAAFAVLFHAGGLAGFHPASAALAGAVGAFLWFNAHPASLFMGDAGSMFLGGFLGAMAVATGSALFLAVAGGLYAWEATSVILQVAWFRKTGRRIFKMSPYHHHLELAGWPETKVTARLWIASAALGAAAVLLFRV